MENIQDKSIFEFNIDEEGKSHLGGIAQWANINAIVGFAGLALSVISSVVAYSRYGSLGSVTGGSNMMGLIITVAISLVLNITLLAAATNLKKGLDQTDQGLFELGLTKFTTYFKILGILLIIALVIFVLVLLIVLIAGASMGFR